MIPFMFSYAVTPIYISPHRFIQHNSIPIELTYNVPQMRVPLAVPNLYLLHYNQQLVHVSAHCYPEVTSLRMLESLVFIH